MARTQARKPCVLVFVPLMDIRKRVCRWSISDWSKARHTCSRRCRSSSMSWTLVSYTRCWMTDHSATELIRPQSGGLCHLVCHSLNAAGNILRVHYQCWNYGDPMQLSFVGPPNRWEKTGARGAIFSPLNRPATQWNQSHKSTGVSFSLDFDAW